MPFLQFTQSLPESILLSVFIAAIFLTRSLLNFSRSGPKIQKEIRDHYFAYSCYAIARLTLWIIAILIWSSSLGVVTYINIASVFDMATNSRGYLLASAASIFFITLLQFSKHLFFIPSSIMMSFNYGMKRLIPLWRHLNASRIKVFEISLISLYSVACLINIIFGYPYLSPTNSIQWIVFCMILITPYGYCLIKSRQPKSVTSRKKTDKPNIIMIGCDTMRSDRLGSNHYHRNLTPNIDKLARTGATFMQCYTPIARTAPSLVSMLTGQWPGTHGVRTNFVTDKQTRLKHKTLPGILNQNGYNTCAITDWCGSDLKKFDFGFDLVESPDDQWNIKFLIKQGPKDLRLFLTLFTHNALGKKFIPELYYLSGIPLTDEITTSTKRQINILANQNNPFFANIFFSTSHPPFGSKFPYYRKFSDPDYKGESFFGMARLTDPDEIIRAQKKPKEDFDLDQIIDLYDGSITNFDSAVGELVDYLSDCNLLDNTIIAIYSDHGIDFFESDSWGQGNTVLTNNSYTIPFVLSTPEHSKHNHKVSQITRTIDIVPTILDLAGITLPENIDGVSLKPVIIDPNIDLDLCAYVETGEWLAPPPQQITNHKVYSTIDNILTIEDKDSGTISFDRKSLDTVYSAKDQAIIYKQWKLCRFPLNDGDQYTLKDLVSGEIIPINTTHEFLIDKLKSISN